MQTEPLLKEVMTHVAGLGYRTGIVTSGVRDMGVIHTTKAYSNDCGIYDPILSLVLQGHKEAHYGNRSVAYGAGDLLIIGQSMPVLSSVIAASPDTPYVAIVLRIDMDVLRSLYGDIDPSDWQGDLAHGLESGIADAEVVDAITRLFRLGRDPLEERALGASATREVYFRVLRSRHAGGLRQLLNLDSKGSRIAKAIAHIRKEYRRPIKASDLASIAGMSASVFYENFKQATASSPLQYQKDLRLLEAHQMLQHAQAPISTIAMQVGYESPAQFSREFSRKFGGPPKTFVGAQQQTP
jgi:AraC-like DNA-binding protein